MKDRLEALNKSGRDPSYKVKAQRRQGSERKEDPPERPHRIENESSDLQMMIESLIDLCN